MLKQLKAFAGAGIAFLLGLGLQMSPFQNAWLSVFLIGLAAFWLVIALFKNKRLIKRFPTITEWLPFLEDADLSLPKELSFTHVQGHTFRLTDIVYGGVINSRTFEDCVIHGPAVVTMLGDGMVVQCTFTSIPDKFIIEVTGNPPIADGVIMLKDCIFRRCRFVGIGFIGTAASRATFLQGVSAMPPSSTPGTGASQQPPAS
jgi:hypothetical protein